MKHQDRDRLIISLVLALVIHAVIVVGLTFADWDIREYPEHNPVYVELLDYRSSEPEPEPPPEPEIEPEPEQPPEQEMEPEPEQPPEIAQPEEPVDSELAAPDEQPEEPATEPVTAEPAAPVQPREESPAPATPVTAPPAVATVTDAPPGSHSQSDLEWLQSESAAERERNRAADSDPLSFDDPSDSGELPAWVEEGTIQPLNTLAFADQAIIADKEDSVPGFQDLLERVLQSMTAPENPSATRTDTAPGVSTGPSAASAENIAVNFASGGDRGFVGVPLRPDLRSEDFNNDVPAKITYVIVFDVNSDGLVVPGSLILRQSSGYTAADQKVSTAVAAWKFDPAPGAATVTAIGTLVIEREDLR